MGRAGIQCAHMLHMALMALQESGTVPVKRFDDRALHGMPIIVRVAGRNITAQVPVSTVTCISGHRVDD
jgi:hypothetical protein